MLVHSGLSYKMRIINDDGIRLVFRTNGVSEMKGAIFFFVLLHIMGLIIRPDAIEVQLFLLCLDFILIPFLLPAKEIIVDKALRIVKKYTRWRIIGKKKEEIVPFDEISSISIELPGYSGLGGDSPSGKVCSLKLIVKNNHPVELWLDSSYAKLEELKRLIQEYIL